MKQKTCKGLSHLIAEIFVELPTQQTNKPFDYAIPEEWHDLICPGIRVAVPFGGRKLLGFVTKIKANSDVKNLKEIDHILDLEPVLNKELLVLGEWLATHTVCYTIAAYQAMLPAALKGKYEKRITLPEGRSVAEYSENMQQLFCNRISISWDEAIAVVNMKELKTALANGDLEIAFQVEDKIKVKTERVLSLVQTQTQLKELLDSTRKNANNQIKLLQFLIDNPAEITATELMNQLSIPNDVIKKFIDQGILLAKQVELYRDPFAMTSFEKTTHMTLTAAQEAAFDSIAKAIEDETHENFLLFGVTGSGKTEVYLQTIDQAIQQEKQAIMLVPEISLTPQMVTRFKGRFGERVAVLHSGLSNGEKYDEWRKIIRGEVSVVVGARSAIYAPFQNLGMIIIDEEHEGTYKQEESPRYHARDVAIKRAEHHKCPVVMGSATPSLESFARAKKGVYTLLNLNERINQRAMPTVSVVDMREELRMGNRSMFSRELSEKISDRLLKKEQIVLLLNRRGHSSFIMCRDCGLVVQCPQCDVSLTYHRTSNQLKCHYCGYETNVPRLCPTCNSDHIRFFGTGTQKVEEEIAKLFPKARVIRMDVDTTRGKGAHERLLKQFGDGDADILLGTQMIAKGLDYPNITLVGVLAADTSLHIADFRASEKTFQLLTQVSGRAGRHLLEGEVVVQTYTPEHYSIELAASQDFESFYDREMMVRRNTAFSPYYFMTLITASSEDQFTAIEEIRRAAIMLKDGLSKQAIIFGPTPSPIAKINNRYRFQCLIKYKNEPNLLEILHQLNENLGAKTAKSGVYLSIDMNPNMMM